MNLREQLDELLQSEEKLATLELENKALRYQNGEQLRIITQLQDDLRLMDRYRALVERASTLAADLPRLKDKLLDRKKV